MSVTGANSVFSPLRGNYSSCVAWRQQGPQTQLVCNTTQVAVNLLAPKPTFSPDSPHQWRDRNQTNRNLLTVCLSSMEYKGSSHVFTPIFVTAARMRRRDLGPYYNRAAWLGLKHEGLKTSGLWHASLPFLLLYVVVFIPRHQRCFRFRSLQHLL